jgi:hypothetical protein
MNTIRLAVVGDHYVPKYKAKELAEEWMEKLAGKYELDTVCTMKEDMVGKYVRKYCKQHLPDVQRKVIKSKEVEKDLQQAEFEVKVGNLMWEATHFLVIGTNNYGYASICEEQLKRMKIRKFKKILV